MNLSNSFRCSMVYQLQSASSILRSSLRETARLAQSAASAQKSQTEFHSSFGTKIPLVFLSSISTLRHYTGKDIPQAPELLPLEIQNPSLCDSSGYAQSKLAATQVLEYAGQTWGVKSAVLRLGQVAGASEIPSDMKANSPSLRVAGMGINTAPAFSTGRKESASKATKDRFVNGDPREVRLCHQILELIPAKTFQTIKQHHAKPEA